MAVIVLLAIPKSSQKRFQWAASDPPYSDSHDTRLAECWHSFRLLSINVITYLFVFLRNLSIASSICCWPKSYQQDPGPVPWLSKEGLHLHFTSYRLIKTLMGIRNNHFIMSTKDTRIMSTKSTHQNRSHGTLPKDFLKLLYPQLCIIIMPLPCMLIQSKEIQSLGKGYASKHYSAMTTMVPLLTSPDCQGFQWYSWDNLSMNIHRSTVFPRSQNHSK